MFIFNILKTNIIAGVMYKFWKADIILNSYINNLENNTSENLIYYQISHQLLLLLTFVQKKFLLRSDWICRYSSYKSIARPPSSYIQFRSSPSTMSKLAIFLCVTIFASVSIIRGWSEKFPTSTWRWQHSSIKASECSCASFYSYSLKFQPIWTRSF